MAKNEEGQRVGLRKGRRVATSIASLEHFGVDPQRLAFEDVTVCEYLTFMEVTEHADVQLCA